MAFRAISAVFVIGTIALTACGGGGNSTVVADPGFSNVAFGNYSTGCVTQAHAPTAPFKLVTLTLANAGGGKTRAVARYSEFASSAACSANAPTIDVTGTFNVLPLGETKTITGNSHRPFGGIATVGEAELIGLTISKLSFTGLLPALGAKTKVGVMSQGNDLLMVVGGRDVDGLGSYFSDLLLKKLP